MTQDIELKFSGDIPKLMVGLSWDHNEKKQGVLDESVVPHNLDLSCVVLGQGFQVKDILSPRDPKRDVYKNQIFHMGDHLTGGSDYEDEEIQVNFENLNADIAGLAFVVSSNDRVKFADVANGKCEFCDAASLQPFMSVEFQTAEKPHYLVGVVVKNDQGVWALQNAQSELIALDPTVLEDALRSAA